MPELPGYYNILDAGYLRINRSLTKFSDIALSVPHANINLDDFSQNTEYTEYYPTMQNGVINIREALDAVITPPSSVFWHLPNNYMIKLNVPDAVNCDIGFIDPATNDYVPNTPHVYYSQTVIKEFLIKRFDKVNSENSYAGIVTIAQISSNNYATTYFRPSTELNAILDFEWIDETTDDPMITAPVTEEGEGGFGDYDYSSDDTDYPDLPTISVTNSGMLTTYLLGQEGYASLEDLGDYLWSGLFDIDTYLRMFQSPMDCVLSVGIIPVTPITLTAKYIIIGNHATTLQAPPIVSQWFDLDCGEVELSGKTYSNTFMDYAPYTKAELYLPYIGTVQLNIDEIMDADSIGIKYHIDLLSGSCVAYVRVVKQYYYLGEWHTHSNVLYQYSGNVLTNIPITSQNFTQILQAVIGAVAMGVSGGASGVAAGTEATGMSGAAAGSAINIAEGMKPSVTRSGNCSSACGMLGTQTPLLMLTFPKIAYAEDMNKERGYPTYMRKTLSQLVGSGYTQIDLAHIKNIPCTDAERSEILSLLESGVEL